MPSAHWDFRGGERPARPQSRQRVPKVCTGRNQAHHSEWRRFGGGRRAVPSACGGTWLCLVHFSGGADVVGMKRTAAGIALTTLTLCLALPAVAADQVTLCHATGLADTVHFVTLTIPTVAVGGHFNENGTPQAGHEDDFFGFCPGDTDPEAIVAVVVTAPSGPLPFDQVIPVADPTLPAALGIAGTVGVAGADQAGEQPSQVGGLTVAGAVPTADASSSSGLTVGGRSRLSASGAARSELPFTGISSAMLAGIALGFATAGTALLTLRRTSHPLTAI